MCRTQGEPDLAQKFSKIDTFKVKLWNFYNKILKIRIFELPTALAISELNFLQR